MENKLKKNIKILFKLTSIILFCLVFTVEVFAELNIKNWSQKNIFTDYGQEVEIIFDLKAEHLKKGQYYNAWGLSFGKSQKINILEVSSLTTSKKVVYTFGGNLLKIKFNKLSSQQGIKIKIKYKEFNDEIEKTPYVRGERVQLPSFLAGTNADIIIQTPENLDVYSLNDKLVKYNNNLYRWTGIVEKDGFKDYFLMTEKKAKWSVTTTFKITAESNLKSMKAEVPLYYVGGNNKILEYSITTSQPNNNIYFIKNDPILSNKEYVDVEFKNLNSKEVIIKVNAVIENNYNDFYWMNNFKLSEVSRLQNSYTDTYSNLIKKILSEDKTNLPTYIKLAKWVHENIEYDKSYRGKNMTSLEILQKKKGVCIHYAILYQDLLRSIGIPAQTIGGVSFDVVNKTFESHAWTMVNINRKWIPIDPTWGIYSGKLPISHIFSSNNATLGISISYPSSAGKVSSIIKDDAKFLEK